jgi:hypothetical protein
MPDPKGYVMEQINAVELHDADIFPDEGVLGKILGTSYDAYRTLLDLYDRNGMTHEWRYYKDGKTWLCKVQKKKKTIVWMSAWNGFMKAVIYFPGKYEEELMNLDIDNQTKTKIRDSPHVGKSKPCMFEIRDIRILDDFEKVMLFKMASK